MNAIGLREAETFSANMTREEMLEWFQKRLQKPAELSDVLAAAKDFFNYGYFSRSLLCLQYYCGSPGASIQGRHLMAYCFMNLGEKERALQEFKRCVKDGYQDDWQLVVELTLDLEEMLK